MLSSLQGMIFTMKSDFNFNSYTKPELLAPAGSFDCLKAAVQNGADAVYLGLKQGSARMGADNFSLSELKEAVSYAHVHEVRVYLAINTLMFDNELDFAYQMAKEADSIGVDALILQDLGLAKKILENKSSFGCEIHASTQMSVYNTEGVQILKNLGFDRCITARELSVKEIKDLCDSNIMEIEVFCHGALCISLSGQCLLSSFIGGRSGNRGTCAQPCRKKYSLCKNGKESPAAYRISPADFAALPHIKELITAGIHSLKIEGRLKSPAYVAAVTKSYREAIDNFFAEETFDISKNLRNMQLLFGRGDFTSGYLKEKLSFNDITFRSAGRIGLPIGTLTSKPTKLPSPKNLPANLLRFSIEAKLENSAELSVGDGITVYALVEGEQKIICGGTVNSVNKNKTHTQIIAVGKMSKENCESSQLVLTLTDDAKLRESIKAITKAESKRTPVFMRFKGVVGDFPVLELFDNLGNVCSAKGSEPLQNALKTATTKEDVKKQLSKLGDTPFYASEIEIELDENIFVPVSVLNALRRECTSELIKLKTSRISTANNKAVTFSNIKKLSSKSMSSGISLFFYKTESFLDFSRETLPDILRPYKEEELTCYIPINVFYRDMQNSEILSRTLDKINNVKKQKTKIIAVFPFISLGKALEKSKNNIEYICENYLGKYIDGFMCENIGDLELLKNVSAFICTDYSLNISNRESLTVLEYLGISRATLSAELNASDMETFESFGINQEIVVGGPIILMRSRHCYIDENDCNGKCAKCTKAAYSLKDSFGCEFPILPQKDDCCSILLSHKNISYAKEEIKKIRSGNPSLTLRVNIL